MSLNNLIFDMATLPCTVEEAVDRLMVILDNDHKLALSVMGEDDLIDLHFSLGITIRNAFGLHNLESKLLADCEVKHPDDASDVIVRKLLNELRS